MEGLAGWERLHAGGLAVGSEVHWVHTEEIGGAGGGGSSEGGRRGGGGGESTEHEARADAGARCQTGALFHGKGANAV